jgi:hypothetical protein
MAKGALKDALAPELAKPREIGEQIDHAHREEHAPRLDGARRRAHGERRSFPLALDGLNRVVTQGDRLVDPELLPADAAELGGRRAVARDEIVELLRRGVAGRARVEEHDAPAGAPAGERGAQACGATSHDDDVVRLGFSHEEQGGCSLPSPVGRGLARDRRIFG